MEKCPCNNQKEYMDCCGAILEGNRKANTAEELMRSRYSAHVKMKIDYIMATVHKSTRKSSNRKTVENWAKEADWQGLEVLSTQKGTASDEEGRVVFKAYYNYDNQLRTHFEDSAFKKEGGDWFYVDGVAPQINKKKEKKIGRNDPCPCGSGKKFKKCCG